MELIDEELEMAVELMSLNREFKFGGGWAGERENGDARRSRPHDPSASRSSSLHSTESPLRDFTPPSESITPNISCNLLLNTPRNDLLLIEALKISYRAFSRHLEN